MQRFINSSIAIRRSRFKETGSKFESFSITSIDLGSSFNSCNLKDEFYTNYANTKQQKVYKVIEDLYYKIKNKRNDLFSDYIFDELYYNGKVIDRLLRIINKFNTINYNLSDLPNIYKLKNNVVPKVHLYVQIINNSVLFLLIDLYHLSIPADLFSNNKLVRRGSLSELKNVYNKFQYYSYNLNNIILVSDNEVISM